MKYVFRGITVFNYNPETKRVKEENVPENGLPAFEFCNWIPEDYRLLATYFDTIYQHT